MKGKMTPEQKDALDKLVEYKGKKVWAKVNTVSRSGMSRRISLYVVYIGTRRDNKTGKNKRAPHIQRLDYWVARATGRKSNEDGVLIGGCGMDMIFALIESINWAVWKYEHPGEDIGARYYNYCFDANDYGYL